MRGLVRCTRAIAAGAPDGVNREAVAPFRQDVSGDGTDRRVCGKLYDAEMPLALAKPFNNFGQQGNVAGVCEAAVCLWIKRIADRVGAFNWGSSAGDWLPTPADSNVLYNQFNNGTYLVTYQSYLAVNVFNAGRNRPADAPHPGALLPCANYGGFMAAGGNIAGMLGTMAQGDAVFLALEGGAVGHAMGVYRGTDYLFLFDPNVGLHRGTAWQRTRCFTVVSDDVASAAQYLQAKMRQHQWHTIHYFGNHLRA